MTTENSVRVPSNPKWMAEVCRAAVATMEANGLGARAEQLRNVANELAAPPDDVLRRVVEALAEALEKILEAADESDSFQYGTLGTAFVRNIAAPALAAHKALAEGVK